MLERRVGPAVMRDLEPWHAQELAELFQREDHDLYSGWPGSSSRIPRRQGLPRALCHGAWRGHPSALRPWLDRSLVGGALFPTINMRTGIAEIGVFLAAPARGRGSSPRQ